MIYLKMVVDNTEVQAAIFQLRTSLMSRDSWSRKAIQLMIKGTFISLN